MPRIPTFPDCFDEEKQISITWLKQLGFIKKGVWRATGPLRWTRAGSPSGSVTATVTRTDGGGSLQLDYLSGGKPISYSVRIEARPSNLGIGQVLYFVCPATGQRCRIIYGLGDYFLSRKAYPSAMYSSQTRSKRWRDLERVFKALDSENDPFRKKYSRTHYKGQPTRRFKRWLATAGRREDSIVRRRPIDEFLVP